MAACIRAYVQYGVKDVPIRPDHVPTLVGEDNSTPGYHMLVREQLSRARRTFTRSLAGSSVGAWVYQGLNGCVLIPSTPIECSDPLSNRAALF